ncbi:MAG: hypothetical protein AAF696_36030 [Bacteroidota bacterium]
MKEEHIKKLIQNSALEASEDFTDRFMESLEEKLKERKRSFDLRFKWNLVLMLASMIFVSLLIALLLPGTRIVLIMSIACMMLALNIMLYLRQSYQAYLNLP